MRSSSKKTFGQHTIKAYHQIEFISLIKKLWPYIWDHKLRALAAMLLLIGGKLVGFALPWALGQLVDNLDQTKLVIVPVGLVLLYGSIRFGSVFIGELRDAVFSRVTESAMRKVGLEVFKHLHTLDLNFHLDRQTGGISRDIDRGTNGINFMMRFLVFNILPTLFELSLVIIFLLVAFNIWFSLITLICVVVYILFSVVTTEWRTRYVKEANRLDNQSNTRAIDSLINYETVKYFNNEAFEAQQYDNNLRQWESARINNRLSLAFLNSGQILIIAVGLTALMYLSAQGVVDGSMSLGDLVMINGYLMQLFVPLGTLGFIYRETRRALSDIENMFSLLDRKPQIQDPPHAPELNITQAKVVFKHIDFAYHTARPIISNLSFTIHPGQKVAIVGPSGSGKSTLARLLFRFYDLDKGCISIDGQDISQVSQLSLRQHMGVVPQDTVLFNDSIWNNVAYGCPDADANMIWQAIENANLKLFIRSLPEQEHTLVGERGLKVSGGEKQRIAVARVLLKNPAILIFDEATSALDSVIERSILKMLAEVAIKRTTLVIAHRLSTIVDADNILVLNAGNIIEQGTHQALLSAQGHYAHLWHMQQQDAQASV